MNPRLSWPARFGVAVAIVAAVLVISAVTIGVLPKTIPAALVLMTIGVAVMGVGEWLVEIMFQRRYGLAARLAALVGLLAMFAGIQWIISAHPALMREHFFLG